MWRPEDAAWVVLMAMVFALAIWLRLSDRDVPNRTPDERTYMAFATQAERGFVLETQALIKDYNNTPSSWFYPEPLRIGYYYLIAIGMKWKGASAEQAGMAISFFSSVAGFCLAGLIGLRFFDRWSALVALALLAVFPADLAIARRVWEESAFYGVTTALLYFYLESARSPRNPVWLVMFWIAGGYSLLMKESAVPMCAFFSLLLVLQRWQAERSFARCAWLAFGCALPALASFGVECWLSQGIAPFLVALGRNAGSMGGNPYVVQFQNGPWYAYPLGFWALSPLATALCFAGLAATARRLWISPSALQPQRAAQSIAIYIVFLMALATAPANMKNLRFMAPLFGPLCLMGGFGFRFVFLAVRGKMGKRGGHAAIAFATIALLAGAVSDYRTFHRVFIKNALDDLAIIRVVDAVMQPEANAVK